MYDRGWDQTEWISMWGRSQENKLLPFTPCTRCTGAPCTAPPREPGRGVHGARLSCTTVRTIGEWISCLHHLSHRTQISVTNSIGSRKIGTWLIVNDHVVLNETLKKPRELPKLTSKTIFDPQIQYNGGDKRKAVPWNIIALSPRVLDWRAKYMHHQQIETQQTYVGLTEA